MPDILVKFLSHSERENQFIIIKTELTDINHFCCKQHCTFSCPKGQWMTVSWNHVNTSDANVTRFAVQICFQRYLQKYTLVFHYWWNSVLTKEKIQLSIVARNQLNLKWAQFITFETKHRFTLKNKRINSRWMAYKSSIEGTELTFLR